MPIVFLKDISGQLFSDLAIVIAVAVIASLIIAVSIIPTAAAHWLNTVRLDDPHKNWWNSVTAFVMEVTDSAKRRVVLVAGLFSLALVMTLVWLPPADYLP